jgi:hypothetical protein
VKNSEAQTCLSALEGQGQQRDYEVSSLHCRLSQLDGALAVESLSTEMARLREIQYFLSGEVEKVR